MRKLNWQVYLRLLVILLMVGVGFYFADKLPDRVPMHWNWQGEVDSYGSRVQGLWTIPIMTVGIMILFWFLPKFDPKREKYQQFADVWEIFQSSFVIFMLYVYVVSLYAAMAKIDVGGLVMLGIGLLFVLLGNYMGKIRQNYFVGIKLPWTLSNEEVWNRTHRVGGWCFVLAGILMVLGAYFKIVMGWLFVVAMVTCLIVPILYSYIIYKKIVPAKK